MTSERLRNTICTLVVQTLKEEREKQGISMTVLAARSGLAQATISFLERELRNPTLDTLLRVTGVLNIELGQVVLEAAKRAKRHDGPVKESPE